MIAQGDFRRLLQADTKERAAIMRKLFGTAPYLGFQNALATRSRELEERSKAVRERLLALVPSIAVTGEQREARLAALVDSEAPDADEALSLLSEQRKDDDAELGRLEEARARPRPRWSASPRSPTVSVSLPSRGRRLARPSASWRARTMPLPGQRRRFLPRRRVRTSAGALRARLP